MQMIQRLPLYLQIKNKIVHRILSYQYKDKLPGEMVLSSEFNVARGTIQQALDELVRIGVLYKQQGKGTFVNRDVLNLFEVQLPELYADFDFAHPVKTQIVSSFFIMADHSLANKMGLEVGHQVLKVMRVIKRLDSPIIVGVGNSYLNASYYDGAPSLEGDSSLYQKLKELYGFLPITADDTMQPAIIPNELRKQIIIEPCSEPLAMYLTRLGKNIDNNILEFTEFYICNGTYNKKIIISSLDFSV